MLISVVTVVRDRADLVASCLDSVCGQEGVAFEHVVIDGASVDGTVELLHRYSSRLAYWHSRPDGGIADAMNQGIAHARGDWLLFLHADDALSGHDALARVSAVLADTRDDVMGFPVWFESGGVRRRQRPRGANAWLRLKTGFLHQATFFRRGVFERVGGYDTACRVAMDYEWFLRAWRAGVPMGTNGSVVPAVMRVTGVSSRRDWPSVRARLAEERAVHARHAGTPGLRLFYGVYWPLYLAYKRLATR